MGEPCTISEALYFAGNTSDYSLNVLMLASLVEIRSGVVRNFKTEEALLYNPLNLEYPSTFEKQLDDLGHALIKAYHEYKPDATLKFGDNTFFHLSPETNAASYAIMSVLSRMDGGQASWQEQVEIGSGKFASSYQLFETSVKKPDRLSVNQLPGDGEPAFLYRPYAGDGMSPFSLFDHEYPANYDTAGDAIRNYLGEWQGNPGNVKACIPYVSCYSGHAGYDYSDNMAGRSILAAADGIVDIAVDTPSCKYVKVWRDPDGDGMNEFATWYWHLSSVSTSNGAFVSRGQSIGIAGATCDAFGTHLHFEVRRNGREFDPYGWGGNYSDPWDPNFWLWANSNPTYAAELMNIDTPAQGETVSGTVNISGWGINRLYGPNTGVDKQYLRQKQAEMKGLM